MTLVHAISVASMSSAGLYGVSTTKYATADRAADTMNAMARTRYGIICSFKIAQVQIFGS